MVTLILRVKKTVALHIIIVIQILICHCSLG